MTGSTGRRRRPAGEVGSLSVEAVMVVPVFLAFFAFVLAVGTLQDDQGTMDAAVQAGARSGSLARTPALAADSAAAAADVVFRQGGLKECVGSTQVIVNEVGADLPQPTDKYYNEFSVTASCQVRIDFGLLTLDKTVTSDFTSVVDAYRGH